MWDDVVAYALWLSEQTGKPYRLPSEAEWEYACRAGTETPWSFGEQESQLWAHAWHAGNSNEMTHPVAEKEPNPWRLCDMHGNVCEWVQDCWHDSYEGAPDDGRAWLEADGADCGDRVIRGGYWGDEFGDLRAARRGGRSHTWLHYGIGFRLARDL
jgi:formylglycine-generating enzyme required for sulfatase activity